MNTGITFLHFFLQCLIGMLTVCIQLVFGSLAVKTFRWHFMLYGLSRHARGGGGRGVQLHVLESETEIESLMIFLCSAIHF